MPRASYSVGALDGKRSAGNAPPDPLGCGRDNNRLPGFDREGVGAVGKGKFEILESIKL